MRTPAGDTPDFGALLRRWRRLRGLSQLALALEAQVSARHLSWLETGRAGPSRAMVLRLAERLEMPLRERNTMLVAAGFAPLFSERGLDDAPAAAPLRLALQRLLDAHEPWPALAVDRHWNLVAANRAVQLLLSELPAAQLAPPLNVLRLSLHPQGLGGRIVHAAAWREHVLGRLARQVGASADPRLAALLAELRALPRPLPDAALPPPPAPDAIALPLALRWRGTVLNFITTVTVFGAPHDVTLAEIAIETLLPADEATAVALRGLHEARAPRPAAAAAFAGAPV